MSKIKMQCIDCQELFSISCPNCGGHNLVMVNERINIAGLINEGIMKGLRTEMAEKVLLHRQIQKKKGVK